MNKIIHYTPTPIFENTGGPVHRLNIMFNMPMYEFETITSSGHNLKNCERLSSQIVHKRFPRKAIFPYSDFLKKRFISYPFRFFIELQTIKSKINYLKNTDFDVFHAFGVVFYDNILNVNRLFRNNFYQRLVDFSFIKKPKIITMGNFLPGFTDDKYAIDAYNHYIDQFEIIICVDEHIYNYCLNYSSQKGYNKKIFHIPNSVDTSVFHNKGFCSSKNLKIGFVGRLAETVDLEMLNKLLKNIPEKVEFSFAVSGDLSKINIPQEVANRVSIHTNIPNASMPDFFNSVDLVFNPVLHLGITRVTLEAMACCRPVIMYNQKNRYPLKNGETGFLVNPNLDEILELFKSFSNNRDKLMIIGLAARKKIEEKYSNEILLNKIQDIYNKIINNDMVI